MSLSSLNFNKMCPFHPHGENHQWTYRNTMVFGSPRQPKKRGNIKFQHFRTKRGNFVFSTFVPEMLNFHVSQLFGGAGDLQKPLDSYGFIYGFHHGGGKGPFIWKLWNLHHTADKKWKIFLLVKYLLKYNQSSILLLLVLL